MIEYTFQSGDLKIDHEKYTDWLTKVIVQEERSLGELSIILLDDEELLAMNREYLGHDYYTDVITFDYSEGQEVTGDIYISWDRVVENAKDYGVNELEELRRVMVHGVLHLMGYKDKSEREQKSMRQLEDDKLKMFHVEH